MISKVAVAAFHEKYDVPIDVNVTGGKEHAIVVAARIARMNEEGMEMMHEANALVSKLYMKGAPETIQDIKAKLLKEMCDLIYTIIGTAVTLGMDIDSAFHRVHQSNMTGKKRLDNGFIVKTADYCEPDLSDLVT